MGNGKPMLDEFIEQSQARGSRFPSNAYVRYPGFTELYVRWTKRFYNGQVRSPCLDIARITARWPGKGGFDKLLKHLRERFPSLHICVECVQSDRFAEGLLRRQFVKMDQNLPGNASYFLEAKEPSDG
jgi:hypothetical protein